MHILLIIHSLGGGGAERVTSHMADYWCNKRYQVSVLTIASTENNRYTLPENVDLRALGVDKISKGSVSAVINNINRIRAVRQAIQSINPDIAISMMSEISVVTGLACINLPVKCIGSERVYPGIFPIDKLWGLLRKYTYRFVDSVVAQTDATEQWILENTTAKRVVTIPNPLILPLPKLEPIIFPEKSASEKWVIGVGRLMSLKQFDHLIRSFASVVDQHPDWNLVIVGEGNDRCKLEKLIESLGLGTRTKLIGRAGNIADWYKASDVFALTSLTEGFPNALIEAMAHGLPCISYDCLTGPGEIIDHGVNGLLIEASDEQAFGSALNDMLSCEKLRNKLSENAAGIVSQLDPDLIMDKWEHEIKQLIGNEQRYQ